MVIPNIVMKFNNCWKFGVIYDLSSAHACRVESITQLHIRAFISDLNSSIMCHTRDVLY